MLMIWGARLGRTLEVISLNVHANIGLGLARQSLIGIYSSD